MPLTQTKKNFVRSLLRHIERVARASGSSETQWFCAKFFYLPQEVGDPDESQPSTSAAQRTGSGREAARETLQSIACL